MNQRMPSYLTLVVSGILLLFTVGGIYAQTAPDGAELTKVLKEFLDGAGRNDAALHDRFWAEDLIYTGSGGRRRGKAELMKEVRSEPAPKPDEPKTVYTGEDIRIQQYGETAIVAFRLVATTAKEGTPQVRNFLNTGTFLKRDGQWRAVGWQATVLPRGDDEVKKEVAAAQADFYRAMQTGDVKTLESLTTEGFVSMDRRGEQKTRKQLLEMLGSKQLKLSKAETKDVTISSYGDTAVARGALIPQRNSSPRDGGSGDAAASPDFYTLTFAYKDGDWKAIALHFSRP